MHHACDRYIPHMSLTLVRYNLAQELYVMDLPNTNVIIGVQWLSTLGPITSKYKTMEMSFNSEEGKRVTLKGLIENAPRVVLAKCMEVILLRFGYLAKWSPCVCEPLKTSGKYFVPCTM
jgi:hypothetical protein